MFLISKSVGPFEWYGLPEVFDQSFVRNVLYTQLI